MNAESERRIVERGPFFVRRSLTSKLILSVTLLLLGLVLVFGAVVRASMRERLETRWREQAIGLARNLALGAELGVSAEIASYLAGPVRGALELEDVRYVIVTDASGRILHADGDTAFAQPAGPADLGLDRREPAGVAVRALPSGGGYEAVAAVTSAPRPSSLEQTVIEESFDEHGHVIGFVRLGVSNGSVMREAAILTQRLAIIGAFVLLLGFFASRAMARRLTEPLKRLAQAATAIGQGQWDHPVETAGEDEIAYLSERLRGMARDLHASQEEIREQNRTLELKVSERTASLSRALDELRELDRLKDAFLSSVSHELRTPLTAIRSFSESMLLYEDEPPETRREFLTVIHRESERLSRLIEEVLDLSKIQSGRRQWAMERFPIEEAIVAARAAIAPLAEERRLAVASPEAGSRTMVYASRDGVQQVLQNLFGNAIKFSPEGGTIAVGVACEQGRVRVAVADEGPGIPEAEMEKVFDRFHQVGDTLTGKPKGTGLGLTICREIIRQHRGEIWAERREEGGTLFVFLLPDSAPSEIADAPAGAPAAPEPVQPQTVEDPAPLAAIATAPPPSRTRPSVLVVDDEPSIRKLFEHELTYRGYDVVLAESGLGAVQLARALRPSIILLDVMMPDLMGFDVIRILKNDPVTEAIPIVVVSVVEDREQGLKLGASDYLTKPVNPSALVERIETLLAVRAPGVLLVSGDVDASADIHKHLSRTRYRLECASSPESAWEHLREGDISLVVVDGQDPTLDAPSFVRAIRTAREFAALPVLVLTSQSIEGATICGPAAGSERYIPRDSGPASIATALNDLLKLPHSPSRAA